MYDVIVVGAGAAGLLASATAASRGLNVLLYERNSLAGKKLRITGKGRCNLTNNCRAEEVLESITNGGRFLHSALSGFAPSDVMELFESLGVPLKTERGGRVFPVSDRAGDIADALWRRVSACGVEFRRGRVTGVKVSGGAVSGVAAGEARERCRAVILCTGGMSYPGTGSTGDGYVIASRLGHTVTPLRPSLAPLTARGDVCAGLSGLTLRNVRLRVHSAGNKKPLFDGFGELLFTHFGISGPLALSASAHMREPEGAVYRAVIDLKPALSEDALDARIVRDFTKFSNKNFSNALAELVPGRMAPIIVKLSGIPPGAKVHSVTRAQRAVLLGLLKRFTLEITGARPIDEAVITSGGVSTREIDPRTMQSKLVRGLYFAGEIIDADAYTGGYNLQIAWSTAYAAGRSVPTVERKA
jgi:predicted Rossmann fold flavoprotein